jgi:hypothetical protein
MIMLDTTYKAINAAICSVDVDDLYYSLQRPPEQQDKDALIAKIVRYYAGVAPYLIYVAGLAVWAPKWRLVLTGFLQALDALAAISAPSNSAPVAESAAADTTTTDPTSTDPGFKAGKDL